MKARFSEPNLRWPLALVAAFQAPLVLLSPHLMQRITGTVILVAMVACALFVPRHNARSFVLHGVLPSVFLVGAISAFDVWRNGSAMWIPVAEAPLLFAYQMVLMMQKEVCTHR